MTKNSPKNSRLPWGRFFLLVARSLCRLLWMMPRAVPALFRAWRSRRALSKFKSPREIERADRLKNPDRWRGK